MTDRTELIEIVARLCAGGVGDDEDSATVTNLLRELPGSRIADLIFNDDLVFGEFKNLTPEQIVDEALRRHTEYMAQKAGS